MLSQEKMFLENTASGSESAVLLISKDSSQALDLIRLSAYRIFGEDNRRRMAAGSFPDYVELQPDGGQYKVDQIKSMRDNLSWRPFSGIRRFVVIKDADSLNPESANAMLKILEEPPEGTEFFLISSGGRLLETIVSRCHVYHLLQPTVVELKEKLAVMFPEEDCSLAVALSEGSMSRAVFVHKELKRLVDKAVELYKNLSSGNFEAVYESVSTKDMSFAQKLLLWEVLLYLLSDVLFYRQEGRVRYFQEYVSFVRFYGRASLHKLIAAFFSLEDMIAEVKQGVSVDFMAPRLISLFSSLQ